MKKILISVSIIAAVAAVVVGATTAFFSDTETSTGNTFTAGSLDLKVDSHAFYNGAEVSASTWALKDLVPESDKFFNLGDVKPGDSGENTISLHVDNDAWLRLVISQVTNNDNTRTEPEAIVDLNGLTLGELRQNLLFSMWLDQGVTPGFQGPQDLSECDNDYIALYEPMIISEGPIDEGGETWDLALNPGEYKYLLADQTACFGVAWRLPTTVGNEVQSDSMSATMGLQVQQHRNNPQPTW